VTPKRGGTPSIIISINGTMVVDHAATVCGVVDAVCGIADGGINHGCMLASRALNKEPNKHLVRSSGVNWTPSMSRASISQDYWGRGT